MANKRGMQPAKAAESGATLGDYRGTRGMFMPKGKRNTEIGKTGSGLAPKPSGGADILGNDNPSHPVNGGLARVQDRPSSPTGKMPTAGSFTPVQNNALANLTGQTTGQAEVLPRGASARMSPQTKMPTTGNPVATEKPRRKGLGSKFYGEY